ncbi:MAG: hypothetical protein D9N11_15755 [Ketobacter sp.]|nr:MAG: hypothetical protein D9N11_15755 [Ketobacter sp.]
MQRTAHEHGSLQGVIHFIRINGAVLQAAFHAAAHQAHDFVFLRHHLPQGAGICVAVQAGIDHTHAHTEALKVLMVLAIELVIGFANALEGVDTAVGNVYCGFHSLVQSFTGLYRQSHLNVIFILKIDIQQPSAQFGSTGDIIHGGFFISL